MTNILYSTGEEVCVGDRILFLSKYPGTILNILEDSDWVDSSGGNVGIYVSCEEIGDVRVEPSDKDLVFISRAVNE